MSILRKMRAVFHDDWCKNCTEVMEVKKLQLYFMPQMVGNYISHQNAAYYKNNLIKVNKKADIPTGYYACGAYLYRCPSCGYKFIKLSVFLPVRDQEKPEETIIFENGEMDDFIYN
ncbi:MAG: hypothetical protein K2I14_06325 [Eubacterium sp.]|nr:hypothetical protein [Eubacterium sp.]